jgi:phosphoribosylformylglycinamidine synthase subunit PurS
MAQRAKKFNVSNVARRTRRQRRKKFFAHVAAFARNFFWLQGKLCFKILFARMKAKIIITPKKAVVDPQGKTVQTALEQMGHRGIKAVHVGKYLEIELDGDKETVRKQLDEAARKFLSNPVIEDYKLEIE